MQGQTDLMPAFCNTYVHVVCLPALWRITAVCTAVADPSSPASPLWCSHTNGVSATHLLPVTSSGQCLHYWNSRSFLNLVPLKLLVSLYSYFPLIIASKSTFMLLYQFLKDQIICIQSFIHNDPVHSCRLLPMLEVKHDASTDTLTFTLRAQTVY